APARLGALHGDSGSDDLREPVEVDRGEPEQRLDLPAHLLRPRLGAEETVPEPEPTRVGPLLPEALADVEGERRRAREPLWTEILEQEELAQGVPRGHRHDRQPHVLRAVVEAETAGEEPVAVSDVDHVTGLGA